MTSPAATSVPDMSDATARWDDILNARPRTPAEQARIQAAYELADAALRDATTAEPRHASNTALLRGAPLSDHSVYQVAVMWHQVLTDADAFARSRASDAVACHADPDAIRAWLAGPSPDNKGTVAQVLGIGIDFDIYGFHRWVRISDLVQAAQDAGVFGVPDHVVGVLHLAGEHGFVDQHRVTLTTPQHGVLCSPQLDTVELMSEHLHGVDAAVNLLTRTGHETDRLLHQRTLLADVTWPTADIDRDQHNTDEHRRQPQLGKAFVPLRVDATAAPAPAGQPTNGTTPVSRPHR